MKVKIRVKNFKKFKNGKSEEKPLFIRDYRDKVNQYNIGLN